MKICVAAGVLMPLLMMGQTPAFDVASVKPSRADDLRGSTYGFTPGGLDVTNGTLKGIVQMAYDVPDFEIAGGPGWIDSERFSISAKAAASGNSDPKERIRTTRLMLQMLLAERFQLQVHRETREIPQYALVIGKGGTKLREAVSTSASAGTRAGCGQMTGTRATMANLAFALTRQMRRPVVDRTGLEERYDFQFEWAPEAGCSQLKAPTSGDLPPDASERPSIFTALQESLGLRLEATKGPVELVVIDRVERPAAN